MDKENEITTQAEYISGQEAVPMQAATLNAEKLAEAANTIKEAVESLAPMWEQLANAIRGIGAAIVRGYEFSEAVRWAEVYNRRLVHFYRHTKKRRIRKKYAKRILAWYQEEVRGL